MSLIIVKEVFISKIERSEFQFAAWCFSSIVFALLSCGVCDWFAPQAIGSGIPQLKVILSGVNIYQPLLPINLPAKIVGVIFIQLASYGIGLEGPIIHCSAIIAEIIMTIPYFSAFKKNNFIRKQLLSTSAATGIVTTWGTPFGGMIFSMELCSSVFLMSNLYKSFACVMIGAYLYKELEFYKIIQRFPHGDVQSEISESYSHYVILGVLCGYFGTFMISTTVRICNFTRVTNASLFRR